MMILQLLRAIFVMLMAAIGVYFLRETKEGPGPFGHLSYATIAVAVVLAVLILAIDILSSRRKLLALSGVFFGLVIGSIIAKNLGLVIYMLVDQFMGPGDKEQNVVKTQLVAYLQMLLNVVSCYLCVSFIMQTKDDFRFIIPYVEFAKQTKGPRPALLDTSILIDGRILDIAELGWLESRVIVPRFVLDELQTLADCTDKLKRSRGRRGLEVLAKLQSNRKVDMVVYEGLSHEENAEGVDHHLVALAGEIKARILTTDFNLSKVAQLRGVEATNLNDLATAMKPIVLPGDRIRVQVIKPGEQAGQGIAYLEDGTMVVVEQGRDHVGEPEVDVTVTSVVQTSAGRMVFGLLGDAPQLGRRASRGSLPSHPQAPAS
jgi:uncharacterized protein YacL